MPRLALVVAALAQLVALGASAQGVPLSVRRADASLAAAEAYVALEWTAGSTVALEAPLGPLWRRTVEADGVVSVTGERQTIDVWVGADSASAVRDRFHFVLPHDTAAIELLVMVVDEGSPELLGVQVELQRTSPLRGVVLEIADGTMWLVNGTETAIEVDTRWPGAWLDARDDSGAWARLGAIGGIHGGCGLLAAPRPVTVASGDRVRAPIDPTELPAYELLEGPFRLGLRIATRTTASPASGRPTFVRRDVRPASTIFERVSFETWASLRKPWVAAWT